MIITIKGADFKDNNIGTLSSYTISRNLGSGATYNGPKFVEKNAALSATITLANGYEFGTISMTMGGSVISAHTISENVLTVAIGTVTGNVVINVATNWVGVGEEPTPENYTITYKYMAGSTAVKAQETEQVTAGTSRTFATTDSRAQISGYTCTSVSPSGSQTINSNITVTYNYTATGGAGDSGTITWELGAINSGGGPNSTDMPTKRIRTAGYLQVESSITIKATGNVEFCPIYYKADKTYISSPNAYQTTDCVVNASQYPLVRLMIRDKTNTSKDLTANVTELGNSIVITGNFVEIPYDGTSGGGTTGGGTSGTTGATGIGEGATWQSGAIDSNSGNGSVAMASRIHTGFIPLGNVTVSVSGDAEFCSFFYNADKTYIKPTTTPTYQKTTQTWTSADGAYLVLMARNSKATTTTIDPSYGTNINIQIN